MDQPQQFWMVKGPGPASATHPSRRSAEVEARRLAALNPGSAFCVMEAVAVYRHVAVERHAFDGHDEDGSIPF